MKPYADSPKSEEVLHKFLRFTNLSVLRETLIRKLFPSSNGSLSTIELKDLSLPIHPNKSLSEKKIASIRSKINLFVTPAQRDYYPELKNLEDYVLDSTGDAPTIKKTKGKQKREYSIFNDKKLELPSKKKTAAASDDKTLSSGQLSLNKFFIIGKKSETKSASDLTPNTFLSPTSATTFTTTIMTNNSQIDLTNKN